MERFPWAESCVQICCRQCGLLWMAAAHHGERGRAGRLWGLEGMEGVGKRKRPQLEEQN